jgi:hypothetical protein
MFTEYLRKRKVINWILDEWLVGVRKYGPVAGSSEHGNEPSNSMIAFNSYLNSMYQHSFMDNDCDISFHLFRSWPSADFCSMY